MACELPEDSNGVSRLTRRPVILLRIVLTILCMARQMTEIAAFIEKTLIMWT
jgi:hypothetical protein